jgi:ligand-binding sensor protein
MERIKLGIEVWKNVFESPVYRQLTVLFRKKFKVSIGLGDFKIMGITFEDWKRAKKSPVVPSGTTPCLFCDQVVGTDLGLQRCGDDEQAMTKRMSSNLKMDVSICHAGLMHLYLPIIIQNQYCGYMGVRGGLLFNRPNAIEWQGIVKRVKDTGIDLETLKEIYFNMRPTSQAHFDEMVKMMNDIIADIARIAIEVHDAKKRTT